MSTFPFDRAPPCSESVLIEPGTCLADILDTLAARMTAEQREAFLSQMVTMDARADLSDATVTFGRA